MHEYFVILTLSLFRHQRMTQVTITRQVNPGPAATRSSIFEFMLQEAGRRYGPEWTDANTLFFSAEPQTLS